jgi:hypothetical protein
VADFLAHGLHEAALGQARRHDVGHDLRLGRSRHDISGGVAEAEHAVAAGVIQHGALERDHPRAAGGQGDIGNDGIVGIEIDEAGLHGVDLVLLVQIQQVGGFVLDAGVFAGGSGDGAGQVRVSNGQAFNAGVVQALGQAAAGVRAKRGEGAEYGHAHLQKFLVYTHYVEILDIWQL